MDSDVSRILTEIELAEFIEALPSALAMYPRRLAFERDCLRSENERLRTDAMRYRSLRDIALDRQQGLEAFVAINQLDHVRNQDDFDAVVDKLLGRE